MTIPARRIARVVISGEWISVLDGTFEVVEMEFVDEEGNPKHPPLEQYAYSFKTENRDDYYGPLSAITLIKLKDVVEGG